MPNQDDTLGHDLYEMIKKVKWSFVDAKDYKSFRKVVGNFLERMSPHIQMQDMKDAPHDRPVLLTCDVADPPVVAKWQDDTEADEQDDTEDDLGGGYWVYADDDITDNMGTIRDPIGWWELPSMQSIANGEPDA